MQAQLAALVEEYRSALVRLHGLRATVPEPRWTDRPAPGRWSVAECVAHLNLTSEVFLPIVRAAVQGAGQLEHVTRARYRRDPAGWLLSLTLPPPVRFRFSTTAPFTPQSLVLPAELAADFERHQVEFVACVRDAEGLRIDRVRIPSPFDSRIRYNAFSALTIVPRHQHRHLWQAEQAWKTLQQRGPR
jgi:hypothetical protein